MRQMLPVGCLMLLLLSACDPVQESPTHPDVADMMYEYEEMYETPQQDMPLVNDSQPRDTSQPLSIQLIDDTPNPVVAQHLLLPEEIDSGWIALFDGQSLLGWSSNNPDVEWVVEEEILTAKAKEGASGLLLTNVPFSDFELVCEFRISQGGNSGIFLRSTRNPVEPGRDCMELNIAGQHPEGYVTGSLVNQQKAEVVLPETDEWQKIHIRVIKNRVLVDIDSHQMLDFFEERADWRPAGLIGLQHRTGQVEFRKVNLRPLTLINLFNGTNLEGWNPVPGSKATFTIQDEILHVQGGPGFLETREQYRDFLFQTQARTESKDVNSGFFFRAETGTEKAPSNGYEFQIQNGFAGADRNRPTNSGTGSIFRRVDARRVVSNDYEWTTLTLVACGPRFCSWVNGFLVVDWADTREVNINPRRGLRLDPGHISLQGHDPQTTVSFRYLRVQELPTCESADPTPAAEAPKEQ